MSFRLVKAGCKPHDSLGNTLGKIRTLYNLYTKSVKVLEICKQFQSYIMETV